MNDARQKKTIFFQKLGITNTGWCSSTARS